MTAHPPDELLTVGEVAAELRVSGNVIYRAIRRRELSALRIGRQWRVPGSALDAYLRDGDGDGGEG